MLNPHMPTSTQQPILYAQFLTFVYLSFTCYEITPNCIHFRNGEQDIRKRRFLKVPFLYNKLGLKISKEKYFFHFNS